MGKNQVIYQRDLLISADSNDLAVFTIKIFGEKVDGKIIVIVESKSEHNPVDYAEGILKNVQLEVFNRIKINMVKNADVIFIFNNEALKVIFELPESINSFHIEKINFESFNSLNY